MPDLPTSPLFLSFRRHIETEYGAAMRDDVFRWDDERNQPYYTALAQRWWDFTAGYDAASSDRRLGAEGSHEARSGE